MLNVAVVAVGVVAVVVVFVVAIIVVVVVCARSYLRQFFVSSYRRCFVSSLPPRFLDLLFIRFLARSLSVSLFPRFLIFSFPRFFVPMVLRFLVSSLPCVLVSSLLWFLVSSCCRFLASVVLVSSPRFFFHRFSLFFKVFDREPLKIHGKHPETQRNAGVNPLKSMKNSRNLLEVSGKNHVVVHGMYVGYHVGPLTFPGWPSNYNVPAGPLVSPK